MSIMSWVTENQETLILQGAKLEEKTETPVTMITTDSKQSGNTQTSNKTNNQGNKGNSKLRQDEWSNRLYGRNQGQNNSQTIQACGFCNLIKENGVTQDYVHRNFKEMHWNVSDRSIWSNQSLPWLMLDVDDRIKI